MNSIKVLLSVIIVLFILVIVAFYIALSSGEKKEENRVNKNPSSIQDRKDALKKVF